MFWKRDVDDNYNDGYDEYEGETGATITELASLKVHVLSKTFGLDHPKISIEYLKRGDMLLISYDDMDKEEITRSYDYFVGVADALNANMQQVSKLTFVIIPEGAEYQGEYFG